MYIIMLGAPGTGKGTIGKILSEDMKLTHISTGDIFREQINKKTELGSSFGSFLLFEKKLYRKWITSSR